MIIRLTLATVSGLLSINPDVVSGLNWNQNVPFTQQGCHPSRGQTALGFTNEGFVSKTSGLVGEVLNGQYLISANVPVASTKCKIYEAYRVEDPQKKPMIVKLSPQIDSIGIEYQNYKRVTDRLGLVKKNFFVEIYDTIEPTPLTQGCAGIVMEKGEDNLRFHIMKKGRYQGDKLRNAMETVIRIVGSLHEEGMVWTEIKAENFVVQNHGSTIKGIDLESAIYQKDLLAMYTAEACPPEFPVEDMYKCLPKIRMESSFDMWGLGMTLFEMAKGKPFYVDGLTDLEYIKDRLRNPEEMISDLHSKLLSVNPEARSIIKNCLMIDPRARSSCQDLLRAPYFTKNKSSYATISSSNFGTPKIATQNQMQTMEAQYEQEDVEAQKRDPVRQVGELDNHLKLPDVSNHQLREELSAAKSEIKGLLDGASAHNNEIERQRNEQQDEVNKLRAEIKASEERAAIIESIPSETEQLLSEVLIFLSDVQSQLAATKEEVTSVFSENKSLLSQISAMTASRDELISNLKRMEIIVNAANKSASMAAFAEPEVVNQVGTSRLQEAQIEVTAHLQQHDNLQHIQNEKLPHGTEQQDPNPPTLQSMGFSDHLASVLDIINVCALHDPDVARDLLAVLHQSQTW